MNKRILTILTTLLLLEYCTSSDILPDTSKVVMVVELNRHGARGPLEVLKEVDWVKKYGKGELTPVGQRQRYYLGKRMAKRFPTIFKEKLLYDEFYIRSTSYNRTIMSAFSQMLGANDFLSGDEIPFDKNDKRLFPPYFDSIHSVDFKTALPLGITPFPIHSRLTEIDKDMFVTGGVCPKNQELIDNSLRIARENLQKSPHFLDTLRQGRQAYGLAKNWGAEDLFNAAFLIGDFAIMDAMNNENPIIKPNTPLFNKLSRYYSYCILVKNEVPDSARAQSTPFFLEALEFMEAKIDQKKDRLKYVMYSGHDDNLAAAIQALGIYHDLACLRQAGFDAPDNDSCEPSPPVASNIALELLKDSRFPSGHAARISYNEKYIKICPDGDALSPYTCDFKIFSQDLKKRSTINNLSDFCKISSEHAKKILEKHAESNHLGYLYFFIFISIVMLFIIIYLYIKITKLNEKFEIARISLESENQFEIGHLSFDN